MSAVLIDSFDMYNGTGTNTGLQTKWALAGANFSMVAGRFGGQALRLQGAGGSSSQAARTLPSSYGTFTAKFAVRFATIFDAIGFVLFEESASGQHCGLECTATGAVAAGRYTSASAQTVLGTSAAGVFVNNTWHYVEVDTTISDTVGQMTVRVDGVQVLNLTGQDTRNAGTGVVDRIRFMQQGTAGTNPTVDYDDFVVNDAFSTGERRVEPLRATADSSVAFTPNSGVTNFSRVNETLVDGDTSYVSSSTVGQRDLYTIGSLSSTPATIEAVQITSFAEKTDASTRTIANSVQSAGTDSDGSAFALAASYSKFERIMLTDPNGGGAWTASRVNNLLLGPKLVS